MPSWHLSTSPGAEPSSARLAKQRLTSLFCHRIPAMQQPVKFFNSLLRRCRSGCSDTFSRLNIRQWTANDALQFGQASMIVGHGLLLAIPKDNQLPLGLDQIQEA